MSRRTTRRNAQRRRLRAELLEDRRLLAAIDLLPPFQATQEEGITIVHASGGSTVRFEASLISAEQSVRGYQLNFANSDASLLIDEFLQSEDFPESIDVMIDRGQGDSIVSSSAETAISVPPTRSLGSFDVTVPRFAGDYRLTIDSDGAAADHRTLVVDGEAISLPITDYGDVILRVSDASETVVTMTTATQSQLEDAGAVTVNVSLSQISNEDVIVPFRISGTASEGDDFTISSSPLTIPAGSISADIVIDVIDDLVAESTETVVVTLENPTGARLGADKTHTLHIVDNDDDTPTAVLSLDTPEIQENAGSVEMTITLSSTTEFDVVIPYSVSGTATRDIDFTISPSVILIPSGETTATLTIDVIDDFELENNETVIVRLDPPTNAQLGSPHRQVLTIIDNDETPPPTVSFRTATLSVSEGVGAVTLDVVLSAPSDAPIRVPVSVSGTATPNRDFTISTDQITFLAGQVSASIVIDVIDDTLIEGNETVVLSLGTPTGALLGDIHTQTLTINDDDMPPPPKINMVSSPIQVEEGDRSVLVTVSLSEPTESYVEVPFFLTGTATPLKDYASLTNVVGFAAGQVQRSFKIHLFEDNLAEEDETIIVTLGPPNYGELGDRQSTTITIMDNDLVGDYPKVSFHEEQMVVPESNPLVWVTAKLSIRAPEEIRVPITIESTASEGSDYRVSQRVLIFERGSSTAGLPIEILDDNQLESPETIVLTLAPPEGLNVGEHATQTITILDQAEVENGALNRPPSASPGSDTPPAATTFHSGDPRGGVVPRSPEVARSQLEHSQVISASGQATAVLFEATEATELLVGYAETSSNQARVRLYDQGKNQLASDQGGLLSASLTAGHSYALVFAASPVDQTVFVRASAGPQALTATSANNWVEPTDVDGNGRTTTLDALMVINQLTRQGDGESLGPAGLYYDVNADGRVSALDALQVINQLSRNATPIAAGEMSGVTLAPLELGLDALTPTRAAASGERISAAAAAPVEGESVAPPHRDARPKDAAPVGPMEAPAEADAKVSQIDTVIAELDDALQLLDGSAPR
ncbi:MAG: Calx-beta domain-containing protein [Novipirellula sp. JB048]